MDNKFKTFIKKLKPNRAVYITAVTLLVALAVIIAITVAANRAKKRPEDTSTTNPIGTTDRTHVTTRTPETTRSPGTDAPSGVDSPSANTEPGDSDAANVGDKIVTLLLPCSGTLSAYHDESLQVWSVTMRDYRVHLGIDIATEANAPVYAAADGVISQIWEDVKMGYCISIKHNDDTYTVYRNLGKDHAEGIKEGVNVRAGQLISSVGSSAMVEIGQEHHLHFEMTVGGFHVNPLDYFDKSAIASLTVDQAYEG